MTVDIFRAGFMGATTDEATQWVASHTFAAQAICVPFAGSGRDIASMAQTCAPNAVIDSWDVQYLSKAVVDGIFAGTPEITIDEPRFLKGRMYESRFLKGIDARSAGLFDYIAAHGSLFEHSALISATQRQTMVGRLTHWDSNVDKFWRAYQNSLKKNAAWCGFGGAIRFQHNWASFFDSYKQATPDYPHYDVVQIDPPKVVSTRDVYSKGPFAQIQWALGKDQVGITEWKKQDAIGYMRKAFEVNADKIIFLYVTGVKPTFQELERVLLEYGELEDKMEFHHQNRSDIGYVVRKL